MTRPLHVENIGIGRVLTTQARSVSIYGRQRLGGRLSLNWELILDDQQSLYVRREILLALRSRL